MHTQTGEDSAHLRSRSTEADLKKENKPQTPIKNRGNLVSNPSRISSGREILTQPRDVHRKHGIV